MSKYHYRLINELRMQLSYSPERRRLEQLDRLSALVGEVRPRRGYRYSAIAQEITRYKPSKCPATKLSGDHLRHDLATLLEDLSLTVNFEAAKCPEAIYSVHQLKDVFDVSPSAILDWRMEGLPARYYVMPDGEKTMGVSQSALEVFMGKIVARAVRSRKFSKVPERKILQRAGRLLSKGKASLTELAANLQEEFGLAELAAKCIIREHDRNDPNKAFYSDTYDPLPAGEKAEMFDAHRNGRSVQRLMTQHGRTRQDIYRIVRQVKAERIMAGGLEFVYNKEFDSPKADQVILKIQPDEKTRGNVGRRDTHVPAYLTDLCKVPLLGKEEEPELFRRYNYLKYKLYCLWNGLRPSELTQAALEDMRWLRNETSELRNRLLEANLRLVIRMAYKHVGPFANVNELISDGNISLMQAVEKFDYSRGFRFSTYASWALLKNFAKTIPEENYQNEKFVTGQSEMLESVPDPQESLRREEHTMTLRAAINRVMAKLSERERSIVCARFGIGEDDAQTLGEVGGKMQVTRERVRQIEARALNKMRSLLKKESIEADF